LFPYSKWLDLVVAHRFLPRQEPRCGSKCFNSAYVGCLNNELVACLAQVDAYVQHRAECWLPPEPMARAVFLQPTLWTVVPMRNRASWVGMLARVFESAAALCTVLLVLLVFTNVFIRYSFNLAAMPLKELEWYLYALGFLLAMGPTLYADQHVRIDIFYARLPQPWQRRVNILGTLLFLFPFALLVLWFSYDFVAYSYQIRESSPNPGGLPAVYLIKAAIPLAFLVLLAISIGMLREWLGQEFRRGR